MMKWPFGGLFVTEDVAAEQARFDLRETVTGGPMFGKRTFATAGVAAEREQRILAARHLSDRSFDGFGKLMGGTRRHNQIYIDDLSAGWEADGLRLAFTLPSGCYATVLLREVMKTTTDEEDEPPED
jgi:tRNA pseudouridine13 synthase